MHLTTSRIVFVQLLSPVRLLLRPYELQTVILLCPQDLPGKNSGVVCHFLYLCDPGIKPVSPALAGGFFTTEPQGKPSTLYAFLLICFSRLQLFETLWNVFCQAPLSMEFLRQKYWRGFLHPPPGYLPHSGIEQASPALKADSFSLSHQESPTTLHLQS